MDGFDLMMMFRWFQRLVALALAAGLLLAPDWTTQQVVARVEHKATAITERLIDGLGPVLQPEQREAAKRD